MFTANRLSNSETNQLSEFGCSAKSWVKDRSALIAIVASAVGVVAIFLATRAPDVLSGLEPVLFVGAPLLAVVAFRNWVRGIQIILVIVIIEGAVRKWFLPSASELVYFYKDFLMVAVLFGYLRKRGKPPIAIKRRLKLVSMALGAFLVYIVLSLGLSLEIHPLICLLGLKAYCLYLPLAFLMPRAFPDKERLIGFLKWYVLIVLPVAAIGVMQFLDRSRDSALNRYAIGEQIAGTRPNVAIFSGSTGIDYVRITSTFSYISGLSLFLPILFGLLLALSSLYARRGHSRGSKILYYSALSATVVTCFMTGSRAAVLSMAVIALIFFLFTSGHQTIRRMQQFAVVGVIVFVAFSAIFPQAYDAFYNRTFGGESQVSEGWERLAGSLSIPVNEASYAGLFGFGIGLTQNAVPALMKRLGLARQDNPLPIATEGEPGRVTLELGVIGFVLYTLMRLILLISVFRIALTIRDRESRTLGVAAAATLVMPLVVGGAVANHTQNVYQWFLVGMVFALYNAERLKLRRVAQDTAQSQIAHAGLRTEQVRNSTLAMRNSQ